jgi:hypothetical protein
MENKKILTNCYFMVNKHLVGFYLLLIGSEKVNKKYKIRNLL